MQSKKEKKKKSRDQKTNLSSTRMTIMLTLLAMVLLTCWIYLFPAKSSFFTLGVNNQNVIDGFSP